MSVPIGSSAPQESGGAGERVGVHGIVPRANSQPASTTSRSASGRSNTTTAELRYPTSPLGVPHSGLFRTTKSLTVSPASAANTLTRVPAQPTSTHTLMAVSSGPTTYDSTKATSLVVTESELEQPATATAAIGISHNCQDIDGTQAECPDWGAQRKSSSRADRHIGALPISRGKPRSSDRISYAWRLTAARHSVKGIGSLSTLMLCDGSAGSVDTGVCFGSEFDHVTRRP